MFAEGLRHFQEEDSSFLASKGRGMACHHTGLGKSAIILAAKYKLGVHARSSRTLIVGGKSAMSVWPQETDKWLAEKCVVVTGGAGERARLWDEAEDSKNGIWCCTFESVIRDIVLKRKKLLKWDLVIVDEMHKARNRKTKAFEALTQLRSQYLFMASATIVNRGPMDLWTSLNLIDRRYFGSYWKFAEAYCHVFDNGWGGKDIEGVKNPEALKQVLSNYIVRRTWAQVRPEIPVIVRQPVRVDMTKEQERIYREIERDMIVEVVTEASREMIVTSTHLAKMVRLRQVAISPLLVGSEEVGGQIEMLLEMLEEDPHTVIFTPFRQLLEPLSAILVSKSYKVIQLYGGLEPKEVSLRTQMFRDEKTIALCTIKFAQSFNLSCPTAYALGFEWNPDDNEQAEGRLQRMDTATIEGVCIRYFITNGSIDEHVIEVLDGKQATVNSVISKMRGQS